MKYTLHIDIINGNTILMNVEFEKECDLKKEVTKIGLNGITQGRDGDYIYYPPTRINEIKIIQKN
jgi:hypothetical protein